MDTELRHASLADQVTEWIAEQIITGKMRSDAWLTEADIAERLKISRSPVREALRNLAREGLVTIKPRRGTVVAELNAKDAADLYDCRIMLEPQCVRLAVSAVGPSDVRELAALLARMEEAVTAGDSRRYLESNIEYHRRLSDLCPNRVLTHLIDVTWRKVLRYRYLVLALPGRVSASLGYHRTLQAAIETGDAAGAADAVSTILVEARAALLANLA